MTKDSMDAYKGWLDQERARPLGLAQIASNQALSPISRGLWEGAHNLLVKATRALRTGDEERATSLVRRAVALPFDDHEGSTPASLAAAGLLFATVVDALGGGDEKWLDSALSLLGSGEVAEVHLRQALSDIAQDYDLSPREQGRIRAALAEGPEPRELIDEPTLTDDEMQARVQSLLRLCVAYDDALAAVGLASGS